MDESRWSIFNPLIFVGIFLLIFWKYDKIKEYATITFGLTEFQLIFVILIIAIIVIYFLKKGNKIISSSQRTMKIGTNPLILVGIFALLIISYPRLSSFIEERTSFDPILVLIILTAVIVYGVYAYSKF